MPSKEYRAYKQYVARRYLRYVRSCKSRVEYMEDRVAYEREHSDLIKGVSYEGEAVKTSGPEHGDDAIARQVFKIEELVDKLQADLALYARTIAEAEEVFSRLTCHEKAQQVMGMMWIERKQVSEIADRTSYSPQRVKQILGDAAAEVFDLMPHEWRDPNHTAAPND